MDNNKQANINKQINNNDNQKNNNIQEYSPYVSKIEERVQRAIGYELLFDRVINSCATKSKVYTTSTVDTNNLNSNAKRPITVVKNMDIKSVAFSSKHFSKNVYLKTGILKYNPHDIDLEAYCRNIVDEDSIDSGSLLTNIKYKMRCINTIHNNECEYIPNVILFSDATVAAFDILTCTAPDYRYAKAAGMQEADIKSKLRERIRFILDIVAARHVDIFILDPSGFIKYGGWNADIVAKYFKQESEKVHWQNQPTIIYAIEQENTYNVFKREINRKTKSRNKGLRYGPYAFINDCRNAIKVQNANIGVNNGDSNGYAGSYVLADHDIKCHFNADPHDYKVLITKDIGEIGLRFAYYLGPDDDQLLERKDIATKFIRVIYNCLSFDIKDPERYKKSISMLADCLDSKCDDGVFWDAIIPEISDDQDCSWFSHNDKSIGFSIRLKNNDVIETLFDPDYDWISISRIRSSTFNIDGIAYVPGKTDILGALLQFIFH